MPTAPIPAELRLLAPGLAVRLTAILAGLAALVARALLRDPLRVALILPLHTRLIRAGRRFASAMRRLAAGIPARAPRPGARPGKAPVRLPTRHAWLVTAIGYHAAAYKSLIEVMLAEPGTAELLAGCPQAARILRPICHMLGVRHPAMPALPRRPRATRSPRRQPSAPSLAQPPAPQGATPPWLLTPPRRATPPCEHLRGWPWFPRAAPGNA